MTREEAIIKLKEADGVVYSEYMGIDNDKFVDEVNEAINMAINALEHDIDFDKEAEKVIEETVKSIWGKPPYTELLDKIRAEISMNAYPIVHGVNNRELGMTLYGILQVIDKYRKGDKE